MKLLIAGFRTTSRALGVLVQTVLPFSCVIWFAGAAPSRLLSLIGRKRTLVASTNRLELSLCKECRRLLFEVACDLAPRDMSSNGIELARLTAEFIRRLQNKCLFHASLMPNLRTSRAPQSYVSIYDRRMRWARCRAASAATRRLTRLASQ